MTSISNGQIQSAEWEKYFEDGTLEEVTYDSVYGSYYLVGFYDGCARNFKMIKLDSYRNEIWSATRGYCLANEIGSFYSSDAFLGSLHILMRLIIYTFNYLLMVWTCKKISDI